jgi:hypothetical protein
MSIQMPSKIVIDKSPIHGWGVFAKEKIYKNEVIEECPILKLPIKKGESSPLLTNYRFNFPSGNDWDEQVIAFGYGSLYNHSDNPNAYWFSINDKRTFLFVANRDIEMGEEILVYYGDINYWNDGRSYIEVK